MVCSLARALPVSAAPARMDSMRAGGAGRAPGMVGRMAERLVVIGANAAGMTAATNARRQRGDLEIVAIEKSSWISYSNCGIPYVVSGAVDDLDDLIVRTAQQ